jgi:hypothetical protein
MEEHKEISIETERKPSPKEEPASSKKIKAEDEAHASRRKDIRTEQQIKIAKMKERDYKLVRGVFKRFKNANVPFKFYYRKYAGPILEYTMRDGHVYEIPYMVAKHLHDNCYISVHQNATDEEGNRIDIIGQKIKQYDFISPDILVEPESTVVTVQRGF